MKRNLKIAITVVVLFFLFAMCGKAATDFSGQIAFNTIGGQQFEAIKMYCPREDCREPSIPLGGQFYAFKITLKFSVAVLFNNVTVRIGCDSPSISNIVKNMDIDVPITFMYCPKCGFLKVSGSEVTIPITGRIEEKPALKNDN